MFSFHSLYPAKLYQKSASEPKVESTTAGGTISQSGRSGSTLSRIEDLELRLIDEGSTHNRKVAENDGHRKVTQTPGGRTGKPSKAVAVEPLWEVESESSLADLTASQAKKSHRIESTEPFMTQESQTELDDRPTSEDLPTPQIEDEALSIDLDGPTNESNLARFEILEQAEDENEDFDECEDQAYLGDLSTFSSKTGSVTRTIASEAYAEPENRQDFARSASVVDVIAISEDEDESPPSPKPLPTEPEEPSKESTGAAPIQELTIPQIEGVEDAPIPCQKASSHSTIPQNEPVNPENSEPRQNFRSNFIPYRRDLETVVAYLIPLPRPTVRGAPINNMPSRYFLYTPPLPHLLKPTDHHTESYIHKLSRHWQQNLRVATSNAHKPAFTAKGLHSRVTRRTVRSLDKFKSDNTAFISRVHPDTVKHLILIHPSGLIGSQTLQEVLQTFCGQVHESKQEVKRQSILRAIILLPTLAIDTAAIFFGGLAEGEGIWMQSSISQYRRARTLSRKMAPIPKETEITREQLVKDAARVAQEPKRTESEVEDPSLLRRTINALRKSMGSMRYSMRQSHPKGKATKRDQSLESGTHDKLQEGQGTNTTSNPVELLPSIVVDSDFCGFLEHAVEDLEVAVPLSEEGDNHAMGITVVGQQLSNEHQDQPAEKLQAKGHNFQLTLCSSPGMQLLREYMQARCHERDSKAFSKPHTVPTEQEVLNMLGWEPQERGEADSQSQADDLEVSRIPCQGIKTNGILICLTNSGKSARQRMTCKA